MLVDVGQSFAVQPRADPGAEDRRVERLGEEVVGAGFKATHDTLVVLDRRDHDHRDVAQRRVGLDPLQHLDPVETWHLDIEEDEVWLAGSDRGQGGEPVIDVRGPMPIAVEVLRKETAVQRIVINDEDVSRTSMHRVSWLRRSWEGRRSWRGCTQRRRSVSRGSPPEQQRGAPVEAATGEPLQALSLPFRDIREPCAAQGYRASHWVSVLQPFQPSRMRGSPNDGCTEVAEGG